MMVLLLLLLFVFVVVVGLLWFCQGLLSGFCFL